MFKVTRKVENEVLSGIAAKHVVISLCDRSPAFTIFTG